MNGNLQWIIFLNAMAIIFNTGWKNLQMFQKQKEIKI